MNSKNYPVEIRQLAADDGGGWLATFLDLPGCMGDGDTPEVNGAVYLVASKPSKKEVIMDTSLVSRNPEIMSGSLCFTDTRVLVKNLFDYLEGASSLKDFLEDFPSVSREKAVAVLEAARERLNINALAA